MKTFAEFQRARDVKFRLEERESMPAGRICKLCATRLSIWNRQPYCALHVGVALLEAYKRQVELEKRRKAVKR